MLPAMRAVVGNILAAVFLLVLVRWLRCGDRLRMLPAAACRRGGLVILALGLLLPLAVLLALPTAALATTLVVLLAPVVVLLALPATTITAAMPAAVAVLVIVVVVSAAAANADDDAGRGYVFRLGLVVAWGRGIFGLSLIHI